MTEGKLRKLIQDLGDTPQAIADQLKAFDCKGERGEHDRCPIANYLRTKGALFVSVAESSIEVTDDVRGAEIPTPGAALAFLELFDAGQFKELEA
ncbi:MAG: hypothetical protein JNM56_04520 [Planctomycetia bacterium]|nr:hypothetical protein [Planctomycetia bacterium]